MKENISVSDGAKKFLKREVSKLEKNNIDENMSGLLSGIISQKGYLETNSKNDVKELLPRDISNFRDSIIKYRVLVYKNEIPKQVFENISQVSQIKIKIFGELEKVRSFYDELSDKFNVVEVGPLKNIGTMENTETGKTDSTGILFLVIAEKN